MLSREVVFLSFCAALALGVAAAKGSASGRIVGGTPAARGEFPWHVSIQNPSTPGENSEWQHVCDGAIISNEYILTNWFCDRFLENSRVVAGTLNWTAPGTIHSVTEFYRENVTECDSTSVWKIEPPFEFNSDVGPVRLPAQAAESVPGTTVTVSGWQESAEGVASEVLVKLDLLPIVANEDCNILSWIIDTTCLICAGGGDPNQGFCSEPSRGAPLVHEGELRGLFTFSSYCHLPAIYTSVAQIRDWITQVTGI